MILVSRYVFDSFSKSRESGQSNYFYLAVLLLYSKLIQTGSKFLKEIRSFCNQKKIILIFDECTSGFRETYGGIHKNYNITPDIALFGKCLGNGYPITAILGKKKYLKKASKSFISSTFWTENSGFVAALKTLEIMKKKKTFGKKLEIGKIKDGKYQCMD